MEAQNSCRAGLGSLAKVRPGSVATPNRPPTTERERGLRDRRHTSADLPVRSRAKVLNTATKAVPRCARPAQQVQGTPERQECTTAGPRRAAQVASKSCP